MALNNGKSIINEKQSQEKLEESVDTFSICTSSSTSVLDTSADSSFDKEQRKISAHATLQVVDDQVPFVCDRSWYVTRGQTRQQLPHELEQWPIILAQLNSWIAVWLVGTAVIKDTQL